MMASSNCPDGALSARQKFDSVLNSFAPCYNLSFEDEDTDDDEEYQWNPNDKHNFKCGNLVEVLNGRHKGQVGEVVSVERLWIKVKLMSDNPYHAKPKDIMHFRLRKLEPTEILKNHVSLRREHQKMEDLHKSSNDSWKALEAKVARLEEDKARLTREVMLNREEKLELEKLPEAEDATWTMHVASREDKLLPDDPLIFRSTNKDTECFLDPSLNLECHHFRLRVDKEKMYGWMVREEKGFLSCLVNLPSSTNAFLNSFEKLSI